MMDLIGMISKSPELFEQLKSLGHDSDQVVCIGGELNRQLRASAGPDLTDLLKGLDVQSFIDRLDLAELARGAGIDPAQAASIIDIVAPAVEAFQADPGPTVGSIAVGLFKMS